jgi:hypothetical protein
MLRFLSTQILIDFPVVVFVIEFHAAKAVAFPQEDDDYGPV